MSKIKNTIKSEDNQPITRFRDIKLFPHCSYKVNVGWSYLEKYISLNIKDYNLDLNPDFQRAHVWTEQQQINYCEYALQGGVSGRDLYFNCKGWDCGSLGEYVIVDGKQRLQAVRMFMRNEIPVFGSFCKEYTDNPRQHIATFTWNIAALETKEEVLNWYLNFNAGGTVHTEEELQKVRDLLAQQT